MIKEAARTDLTPARTSWFHEELVPDEINQVRGLLQVLSKAGLIPL